MISAPLARGRPRPAAPQRSSLTPLASQGVLGDRFCTHKAEFNRPIDLPGDGAGGSGTINREFQYVGNCVRANDATRDHGCYRKSIFPSPQAVISCGSLAENASLYPQDAGCNGGNSVEAWRYFHLSGAPSMDKSGATGCVPYTSSGCVTPGGDPNNDGCRKCAGLLDQCADSGLPPVLYKVSSYGVINRPPLPERADPAIDRPESPEMRQRELNIMAEVYANGPVLGCIFDYANFVDFYNKYPLGVYNSTDGSEAFGGHCMNIMGWGVDEATATPYWILRNSWGAGWGSAGVVRFKKGVDFLGIESDVWAACPAGAARCALTDGVDTSVMAASPLEASFLSRGGGRWMDQKTDAPLVLAAAAAFVAEQSGEAGPPRDAPPSVSAAYLSSHGVSVTSAHSQVVSGFRVRLELSVPGDRVAEHSLTLAGVRLWPHSDAVRLLPPPLFASSSPAISGCDTGAACAGSRSSTTVNGLTLCCPRGCGSACSVAASSRNGRVTATCACAAGLRVDMAFRPDGGLSQHGSALRVPAAAVA